MIDWTKPIQTRAGEPAILVHTYSDHVQTQWPRVCIVGQGTRSERMCSYTHQGLHAIDRKTLEDNDIVNVPEEKALGVVNVYKTCIESHDCREYADDGAEGCNRTHVITIKRIGDKVTAEVEDV